MNKNVVAIGLVAVALAACEHMPTHDNDHVTAAPDPANPKLYIVNDNYIVVDQEPVQFVFDKDINIPVTITWHLPKDGPYSFVKNGIAVARCGDNAKSGEPRDVSKCAYIKNDASPDIVNCGPIGDGKDYQCTNLRRTYGQFKYTITVWKGDKQLPPLDPTGHNGGPSH